MYDYILAVREQAEPDHGEYDGDEVKSLTSSPANSNGTVVSAGLSSTEVPSLHRGVFHTPPCMFVEHHQVQDDWCIITIIQVGQSFHLAIFMLCYTNNIGVCTN
ncbi:hypothetical protein M758_UG185800 [Ceratodon purpureus]|nr:hypothetical protein M758_UG185800 [Ceratodon purpureus]